MSHQTDSQGVEPSHPVNAPDAAETAAVAPAQASQGSEQPTSTDKETGSSDKGSKKESHEGKNQDRATASSPGPSSPTLDHTSSKPNGKDTSSSHSHQSSLENLDDEPAKPAKKSAFDLLDYVTYWERVQMGLARGTKANTQNHAVR